MEDQFQSRLHIIRAAIVLAAIVLIYKCFELQILDSSYEDKANSNVVQKLKIYPSRGLIFDRNGKLLVNNNAMYDLMVNYSRVKEIDTTKFCRLLSITKKEFENNLNKNWKDKRFSKRKAFVFLKKISAERYARFQESLYEFPGFFVQLRNVRGYAFNTGAHVLGYISEVTSQQIEESPKAYTLGDYIGISGLEAKYEKYLRGEKGKQFLLQDKWGQTVGPYKQGKHDIPAISGKDLVSTLDVDLQLYGEKLMQNKRGSVVAIEPSTGEILALVSSPGYDPNLLSVNRQRPFAFRALLEDTLKPLFNRALMAEYPPGSTFKPIMALIAMEEGTLTADRGMTCNGAYNGKPRVGCHRHSSGIYNVQSAIQHSCNNYFCHVFRELVDKYGYKNADKGLDALVQHWYDFGIGEPLGIDIPNELGGNVPTTDYYDRLYPKNKGSWKSPTVISLAIGQGELLLTPLQIANLSAIIANRGYYYIPHLAKNFLDKETNIPEEYLKQKRVRVSSEYFEPVVDGMEQVVLNGTARVAQIPNKDIPICGKTGTSENPHGADHSVFMAFAPKINPKIAIVVYVENSGYGSRYAAPISSLMIEKYLTSNIDPSRKHLEERMFNANLLYENP